jgi:hypothetical protein
MMPGSLCIDIHQPAWITKHDFVREATEGAPCQRICNRSEWVCRLVICVCCRSESLVCLHLLQLCAADSKAVAASDARRLQLKELARHVRTALSSDNFSAALQGGLGRLACCSVWLRPCRPACVLLYVRQGSAAAKQQLPREQHVRGTLWCLQSAA